MIILICDSLEIGSFENFLFIATKSQENLADALKGGHL